MKKKLQIEQMSKITEDSIKTLQQFYSMIVALALTSAMGKLVDSINSSINTIHILIIISLSIAFLSTIVPFYHGMNRHLYETHIRKSDTGEGGHPIPLLVDIFVFIFESGVLFTMGRSLDNPRIFFLFWCVLLCLDIIWSIFVWRIQKSKKPLWALNNFIFFVIGIIIWFGFPVLFESLKWFNCSSENLIKIILIALVEIFRSVFDYKNNWIFYFPWSSRPIG